MATCGGAPAVPGAANETNEASDASALNEAKLKMTENIVNSLTAEVARLAISCVLT
jgi:hypothetical protein